MPNLIKFQTDDGQVVICSPKHFEKGGDGFYGQVNVVIEGKLFTGQVMFWPKKVK